MNEEHFEQERPQWDQDVAEAAIGKKILVGVTYLSSHGETVLRQVQYYGTIIKTDETYGVVIECEGAEAGETRTLPPDMTVFTRGRPGEYRLRSTAEVVADPDFVASWTIRTKAV